MWASSGIGMGEKVKLRGEYSHMISRFWKEQHVRLLNSYVTTAELHFPRGYLWTMTRLHRWFTANAEILIKYAC